MYPTSSPWNGRSRMGLAALLFIFLTLPGVDASPAWALFQGFDPQEESVVRPVAADGRASQVPAIAAYELGDQTIRVDGHLDDAAWARAHGGAGFGMWDPDRGSPATEQTVFKVAYDDEAIYFAVACLESDCSNIASTLSRRDRFVNSDFVSIFIDPYHDKTTGYNFRVNPQGVLQDRYVYNDGDTDLDWDAVWQAETYRDEHGWYAEIRVPFSSIRYRRSTDTWGIQVRRWMHTRGEDDSWSTWDLDTAGFVSRFGTLTGLREVPPPRQLEFLPYVVYRTTDPAVAGPADEFDSFENLGLDVKYGVTSDLTLNATIQPDFGQVEADPSVLNLSPFETFFSEKRPFFVEGSRFFQHPEFNLFYSRRIGTGSENSRIRYASKLTGKVAGDVSVAALFAATDVTREGQSHNIFKNGEQQASYFVGRFGKEFDEGNYRFNVMQTVSAKSGSRDAYGDLGSREAYTTGVDFRAQFADKTYRIDGAFAGSIIDPEGLESDPDFRPSRTYGTGGELSLRRSGNVAAGTYLRWESDRFDINDVGFLSAPDEIGTGGWASFQLNPKGESSVFNSGNLNLNYWNNRLYGARTGYDLHTGEEIWSYERGHRNNSGMNVNAWAQFRSYREAWFGVEFYPEGTQRFETRTTVQLADGGRAAIPGGGPLIDEPTTWGGWAGIGSDSRKSFTYWVEGNHFRDTAENHSTNGSFGLGWNQSNTISHDVSAHYRLRIDDTQHVGNFENPGGGIGGVSYVFGEIEQRTFDLTLRTNVLFSRNQSLEVYAQPFITVGDYTKGRELVRPDTYDLAPYTAPGFEVSDNDFSFAAVNLNAVYRWEYRPGSAFFFVWSHSRSAYDEAGFHADRSNFDNGLAASPLFENEPENTVLAKITYWFPL